MNVTLREKISAAQVIEEFEMVENSKRSFAIPSWIAHLLGTEDSDKCKQSHEIFVHRATMISYNFYSNHIRFLY